MLRFVNNLRVKAIVFVFTTLALSLYAVFYTSTFYMESRLIHDKRREAENIAKSIANASVVHLIAGNNFALRQLINTFVYPDHILFILIQDSKNKDIVSHTILDDRLLNEYKTGRNNDQMQLVAEAPILLGRKDDGSLVFHDADRDFNSPSDVDVGNAAALGKPQVIGKVIVGLSMKPVLQAKKQQRDLMFIVLCIAVAISTVVIFMVVSLWISRLNRLVAATWRISHGNLGHPLRDNAVDEIGKLSSAFEIMRKSLKRREQELKRLNDTLRHQVKERTLEVEMERDKTEARLREVLGQLALTSSQARPQLKKIINIASKLLQEHAVPAYEKDIKELEQMCESVFAQLSTGYNALVQSEVRPSRPMRNFDLYTLIDEILLSQQSEIKKNGSRIFYHYELNAPKMVSGDYAGVAEMLTLLMLQLLAKTHNDNVRVHVWHTPITPGESYFSVEVITAKALLTNEAIQQLRGLADGIGGKLLVDTLDDQFISYRFEIVMALEEHNFGQGKAYERLVSYFQGLDVLYISRHVGSHAYMHRVMEGCKAMLVSVNSGNQALEIMKERAAAGKPFRFILAEDTMNMGFAAFEEKFRGIYSHHAATLVAINPSTSVEKYDLVYTGILNNIRLLTMLADKGKG